MKIKWRILSSISALTVAFGTAQIFALVRNIILARILSPDDFGLATALVATATSLELMSDLSVEKLAVQSDNAPNDRFLNALHLLNFVRALPISTLLVVMAKPLADFLNAPDAAPAFQVMALAPILRSFIHLDTIRQQKDLRFLPLALTTSFPPFISMLLAWPLATLIPDFRTMAGLILAESILWSTPSSFIVMWSWS